MLHSFLYAPFADAARQDHFDAVQLTLEAEARSGTAVLLGNLPLGNAPLDALLVRPDGATALFFLPGGQLTQAPGTQAWQLDGQPLPQQATANSVFQRFEQQAAIADWLTDQLGALVVPTSVKGLATFFAPVILGPETSAQLATQQATQPTFRLVTHLRQLPQHIQELAGHETVLSEATLQGWVRELAGDDEAPQVPDHADDEVEAESQGFWEQKARQLWRWLGAEDVPHDAPYGGYLPPVDAVAASQQEKARLEQIRQQVRAELQAQSQAAATREAEREQTIARLQAQLSQAAAVAPESSALQARLAAEAQAQAALEAALQSAQAESAAKHAQLDARIEQLGTLIQQLQARPAVALPSPPATPAARLAPAPSPAPTAGAARPVAPRARPRQPQWQLRWSRVAIVLAVLGWAGLAIWGLTHVAKRFISPPAARHSAAAPALSGTTAAEQDQQELVVDSTATEPESEDVPETAADTTITRAPEPRDSSEVMPEVENPDLDQ